MIIYKETTGRKGYVMCIPVPKSREGIYAGENVKHPHLSIELLFSDEIIEPYCRKENLIKDQSILIFKKEKKTDFAKKVVTKLDTDAFNNFAPLFEIINGIIENA